MNKHNLTSKKNTQKKLSLAGIHLAGAHSSKSSLVILTGTYGKLNLSIEHIYARIGTTQQMGSDDRILSILKEYQPEQVFFDCPLTLPPCVQCVLPTCPGQQKCPDLTVNYMERIYYKYLKPNSRNKKNKKLFNPQYSRLWDLWWNSLMQLSVGPSFGANSSTTVVRAQVLKKRMLAENIAVEPRETSPRLFVDLLKRQGLFPSTASAPFSKDTREQVILYLLKSCGLAADGGLDVVEKLSSSYENFAAFVAAVVARYYVKNEVFLPPANYLVAGGWVYLPKTAQNGLESLMFEHADFAREYDDSLVS